MSSSNILVAPQKGSGLWSLWLTAKSGLKRRKNMLVLLAGVALNLRTSIGFGIGELYTIGGNLS
jgi:hypothetical protein